MNQTTPDPFAVMLRESIDQFFAEYRKGVTDFSSFIAIFSRLLQQVHDPSPEFTWFYSALTFHTAKFAAQGAADEQTLLIAKDLLQLLVSCSAPCCPAKRIASLAPLIYVLFHLVMEKGKLKREVEHLIDRIIGYISICCGEEQEKESEKENWDVGIGPCFVESARVWMVDKFGEDLGVFFPLIGDGVCKRIGVHWGVKYLAGIVMREALLLRLCLKLDSADSRLELQKELHNWVVQTIIEFRSYFFFDILLGMLLEPSLPVTSLLDSTDEALLREVLYDVVIANEDSFLKPRGGGTQEPAPYLKQLALTWLFVVDDGIQFVREKGNVIKTISYLKAFTDSHLPSQLIQWVVNQPGFDGHMSKPNISTPISLIKWLLTIEDQGVRLYMITPSPSHKLKK